MKHQSHVNSKKTYLYFLWIAPLMAVAVRVDKKRSLTPPEGIKRKLTQFFLVIVPFQAVASTCLFGAFHTGSKFFIKNIHDNSELIKDTSDAKIVNLLRLPL